MVGNIHYRWDFIGLSTDNKPTPADSPKVVNGSTFYESNTSKLYVFYNNQWYERKPLGGGGGGGSYTAGEGITIADDTISVDTTAIQTKLTAGSNITISDDTISATDTTYSNFTGTDGTADGVAGLVPAPLIADAGEYLKADGTWATPPDTTYTAGTNITITNGEISATDTTYSNFTGTDGTSAGAAGLVPAPATTDAGKFLKADGTWDTAGGGSGPTVVQTFGTSTTDVMSQKAVSNMIYPTPTQRNAICICGSNAQPTVYSDAIFIGPSTSSQNNTVGQNSIGIGKDAIVKNSAYYSVALGDGANAQHPASVALTRGTTTAQGQIQVGLNQGGGWSSYGYNSSEYRLISGVYDGQSAHDVATVGQINATIDAINTALSTNIPHIGA